MRIMMKHLDPLRFLTPASVALVSVVAGCAKQAQTPMYEVFPVQQRDIVVTVSASEWSSPY